MNLQTHKTLNRLIKKIDKLNNQSADIHTSCDITEYLICLKSELDKDFHMSISDKEFKKYGHLYYK